MDDQGRLPGESFQFLPVAAAVRRLIKLLIDRPGQDHLVASRDEAHAADVLFIKALVGRGEGLAVVGRLVHPVILGPGVDRPAGRGVGKRVVVESRERHGAAVGLLLSELRDEDDLFGVDADEDPGVVAGIGQAAEDVARSSGGEAHPGTAGLAAISAGVLRTAVEGAVGADVEVIELGIDQALLGRDGLAGPDIGPEDALVMGGVQDRPLGVHFQVPVIHAANAGIAAFQVLPVVVGPGLASIHAGVDLDASGPEPVGMRRIDDHALEDRPGHPRRLGLGQELEGTAGSIPPPDAGLERRGVEVGSRDIHPFVVGGHADRDRREGLGLAALGRDDFGAVGRPFRAVGFQQSFQGGDIDRAAVFRGELDVQDDAILGRRKALAVDLRPMLAAVRGFVEAGIQGRGVDGLRGGIVADRGALHFEDAAGQVGQRKLPLGFKDVHPGPAFVGRTEDAGGRSGQDDLGIRRIDQQAADLGIGDAAARVCPGVPRIGAPEHAPAGRPGIDDLGVAGMKGDAVDAPGLGTARVSRLCGRLRRRRGGRRAGWFYRPGVAALPAARAGQTEG